MDLSGNQQIARSIHRYHKLTMKHTLTILLLVVTSGCAVFKPAPRPAEVVTSEFRYRNGTNEVSMAQPKDTQMERFVAHFPDGSSIEISGYMSTANSAAIAAVKSANEAQAATAARGIDGVKEGFRLGLEAWTHQQLARPETPQPKGTNAP